MNPSILITPNSKKAGKLDSIIPTDGTGDLDVVRATTATYVGSDGLIKTALANEPRFDYSNGSCPSILVEPQRTNLLLRSEELNLSPWNVLLGEVSVTPNSDVSPNGTLTADRIDFLSGSTRLVQVVGLSINTTYTLSFYCKNINATQVSLLMSETTISTGVSYFNEISTTEWSKVSISFTTNSNNTLRSFQITRDGNIGGALLIWGAQLEVGSNATSYIPTTTSSVTRNADVISKTGISDLIGQSEGTLFLDAISFNFLGTGVGERISFNDGTFNNRVSIDLQVNGIVTLVGSNSTTGVNGSINTPTGVISANNRFKIAIAYDGINSILYVNGVAFSTIVGTIPTFTGQLTKFEFNQGNGARPFYGKINSVLSFKTRLSNLELQELTTL